MYECSITPMHIYYPTVVFNAPFKVETAAMKHMEENLEPYLQGKFTAGERRILITKWVSEAWDETMQNKDVAIRAFKKCGWL